MPYKNKEEGRQHNREYMLEARQRARQIIVEAKDQPCVDCGESYPPQVMHFDHVHGTKLFGIAKFVQKISNNEKQFDRLRAEIAKCVVRCANCHSLRHG